MPDDPSSESPARWRAAQAVLDEFQSWLAPTMPRFALMTAVDRTWSEAEYERSRPAGFPSRLKGVYLLFDGNGSLRYVGVASYSFDKRVWTHDARVDRRWTDIIPFPDEFMFLAATLEVLLIRRLNPPCNRQHRGDDGGLGESDGFAVRGEPPPAD